VFTVKIYNLIQANVFIQHGATVIGCGLGNKYKTYLEFEENELFKELMNKWVAREI
jgi:hypothetical protein